MAEVPAARVAIFAAAGYDLDGLAERLRQDQASSGHRQLQYEMFYSAAQSVVNRRLYRANDWRAATARVDRLLAAYRRR